VLYLPKGKAYELQTWYTDGSTKTLITRGSRARWPPKSTVKVARSRSPSDRCWPISRERKVPETPKLVGKLPTQWAIMRNRFEVEMSKVKVTRLINTETKSVWPTNFKLGKPLEHELSTALASYKGLWSWVTARGRGHTVSAALGGHITSLYSWLSSRTFFIIIIRLIFIKSLSLLVTWLVGDSMRSSWIWL